MALERVPISCGEFIGYRVWEVHMHDGVPTLRSWFYDCFWPPGGVVSDQSYTKAGLAEGPIDDNNERGVWAFKSPELLREDFANYYLARLIVYGTCYMWGTIIEHERGYRSQYARVLSLDAKADALTKNDAGWCYNDTTNDCDVDLDFLRARYGVK